MADFFEKRTNSNGVRNSLCDVYLEKLLFKEKHIIYTPILKTGSLDLRTKKLFRRKRTTSNAVREISIILFVIFLYGN